MSADAGNLAEPELTAGPRADTLAESVLILLAMTVVQRLVGFARSVLFCRWLDLEQLGQWDVTFSFLNLAAPLVVLGLPGSFGRYVEHYRQRGQLHRFLRRTTLLASATAVAGVLTLVLARDRFSQWIFGRGDQGTLVLWVAVALASVIFHHYVLSLLIGLRRMRMATILQFAHSMLFAAASGVLVLGSGASTQSVVVGFAVACLVSTVGSLWWLCRSWVLPPDAGPAVEGRAFWGKLLPFAFWVWATNILSGAFEIVDRYMLLHVSGLSDVAALEEVGHYHSSRIIPFLFYTIAGLLGSIITPYLTHDWEAGRREAVVRRLNLVLKSLLLSLLAASLATLVLAPPLFDLAFPGKFNGGLAVLPWTLTYFAWFGTFAVVQNYLWCAEKARLGSLAILVGLAFNVGLNLVLVPRYGLLGAAWSTTAANLLALLLVYALCASRGMRFDRGTWLLTLAPAALCLGVVLASCALVVICTLGLATNWIFGADEKRLLAEVARDYLVRGRTLAGSLLAWVQRGRTAAAG